MRLAVPAALRDHLTRLPAGVDVAWYSGFDECRTAVADAEVLWIDFFRRVQIETLLREARRLRWIFSRGAGMDRQPLDLFRERGLTLTNGSGLAAGPIAESLVLAMLAAAKRFPDLVRAQDRREWLPRPPGLGELQGSRALVLGYGAIGHEVAARLRGFGVDVVGVRRHPVEDPAVIGPDEWRARLHEFDWVLVTVASTASTRHLVGTAELAAMKPGAWLLNVTRGWIIDQRALLAALRDGPLGGAYLDVTDPEPLPPDHPLLQAPNLIVLPHLGSATHATRAAMARLAVDNLLAALDGRPMPNPAT